MRQLGQRRALALLLAPALVFIAFFFVLPLLIVMGETFRDAGGKLTLARYVELLADPQLLKVYGRTLGLGAIVTPIAALASYPAAYAIARMGPGRRSLMMSLVVLPLMTSPVARTYAWLVILGRYGLVNGTLQGLHLIDAPLRLIYTPQAIVMGLLQLFLPLMLLSLVSAMENIPDDLEEAARSLGAGPIGAFFRVTVPLSMDGLVIGGTLVFTGCITAYVTPAMLGGTRVLTLATLMQQKALVLMDWEGATVVAVVMVLTTLVLYTLLRSLRPRT
jgi:putative spermidine/putrescine transport system permease protein